MATVRLSKGFKGAGRIGINKLGSRGHGVKRSGGRQHGREKTNLAREAPSRPNMI